MFYVSVNDGEDFTDNHESDRDDEESGQSPVANPVHKHDEEGDPNDADNGHAKSLTLKSNASQAFGTPPESPTKSSPEPLEPDMDTVSPVSAGKPPIPPPRTRRKAAIKNLEKLKLAETTLLCRQSSAPADAAADGALAAVHSDILLAGYVNPAVNEDSTEPVKGHLSMLVISAKGLRQIMKVRWFVCDRKLGKLRYYRSDEETELMGEICINSATFKYDVKTDKHGEFTVW